MWKKSHTLFPAVGVLGVLVLAVLVPSVPVYPDDRDLLRFNTANPYLFILLDTSASMNLTIGGGALPAAGHGDDPASRLYTAKSGLFEVFEPVEDVNFGFASFNQDRLVVHTKHWLYYFDSSPPGNWPLTTWPTPDTQNGLAVDNDGDGLLENDVQGDVVVLGRHINAAGEAASCDAPLDLDDPVGRARFNAFPKLNTPDDPQPTVHWVEEGGITYRVTMARATINGAGNPHKKIVGEDGLSVDFTFEPVVSCSGPALDPAVDIKIQLRLDLFLGEFLMIDRGVAGGGGGNVATEMTQALWDWQDAFDKGTCDSPSPFSGKGWEGNYDGGIVTGDATFDGNVTNVDEFCVQSPALCLDYHHNPTQLSPISRALDRGDVLPFDWNASNKTAFLQRLSPSYPENPPDFRISPYFEEDPATGLYVPTGRPPLIARGDTPLAKAVNDFRCWYLGTQGQAGSSKCGANSFSDEGWSQVACTFDSRWGCRRPFLIIISDGVDTCAGESPAADSAAMNSHSGVKTWALNLGNPDNCTSSSEGNLKKITDNGKGECVNVATRQDLVQTLQNILGIIREESRAFASAAVPSVQATADQALYHSTFTPLRQKSVWDGHLNAFLKPLMLDANDVPDTTTKCADKPPDEQSGCFLWDAGQALLGQVPDSPPFLGTSGALRRVFYSRRTTNGKWHAAGRLFDFTDDATSDAIRYDLWRGMRLIPSSTVDGSLPDATETTVQNTANTIITKTLEKKTATLADGSGTVTYVLGDVFHSNPIVIGSPTNTAAFVADTSGGTCDLSSTSSTGYRCFFRKHQFRRKVLAVGTNDGMMHFFNTGTFDETTEKFDNGTGQELFAYMPRGVLPVVKKVAQGTRHQFSVDGNVVVSDVFIHPGHNGMVDATKREWRTVLIGGLREGGKSYYALDITQPDELNFNDGEFIPDAGSDYVPSCLTTATDCGPVPYGSAVWEFDDTIFNSVAQRFVPLDEDANNSPDLGFTWSRPNVGKIQFCAGNTPCDPLDVNSTLEERTVAVFGGGMDPENKLSETPNSGNWLYILDIETGEVLYKRQLLGAAPSEPAAVDTDADGLLDRVYIGTTAGYMYRVDLKTDATGKLPALGTESVTGLDGNAYDVSRIPSTHWAPRILFDTLAPTSETDTTTMRRPIYFRPSVLFVAKLGDFAVAFGAGEREDLWSISAAEGRFYTFVDDTGPASPPITESDLVLIDATTGGEQSADLLVTRSAGQKGFILTLEPDERVITEAFALSGVTIFSSFQPETPLTDENGDPISEEGGCSSTFQSDTDNFCSRGGTSRIFVVNTTNGNGFLFDTEGLGTRYTEVPDFVTSPYSEQGQTKNPEGGQADSLTVDQLKVLETLKSLFPDNCKFAHFRIDIRTVAADTSVQHIASVPVCMIEKNWKEF